MAGKHRKNSTFIDLDSPDVSLKAYITFSVVYVLVILAAVAFL